MCGELHRRAENDINPHFSMLMSFLKKQFFDLISTFSDECNNKKIKIFSEDFGPVIAHGRLKTTSQREFKTFYVRNIDQIH
eukprot:SAG11_NODE_234_length_11857_cov_15.265776_2_plen_81_part_00